MKKKQMNINQLRDMAVYLGADRKKLYGTSRQSMLLIIDKLEKAGRWLVVRNGDVVFSGTEGECVMIIAKDETGDIEMYPAE